MPHPGIDRHRIFHLLLHPQRHFLQGQFAKLKNVFRLEEIIQSRLHLLRTVYLPGFQAFHQLIRGQVDIHDFVGLLQYAIRYPFFDLYPGDVLHFLIQPFKMLDIHCGDHADTRFEDIHYILPTLFVFATFYIGMRQLIHDDNFGVNAQNCLQVHLLHFLSFIKRLTARYLGQPIYQRLCFDPSMCLYITYLYVDATAKQLVCLLKHPVRFAYTGNHTDVDLEVTTARLFQQVEKVLYTLFPVHPSFYITVSM